MCTGGDGPLLLCCATPQSIITRTIRATVGDAAKTSVGKQGWSALRRWTQVRYAKATMLLGVGDMSRDAERDSRSAAIDARLVLGEREGAVSMRPPSQMESVAKQLTD